MPHPSHVGSIAKEDFAVYCPEEHHEAVHIAHTVLVAVSMSILITFLIEMFLVMLSIGMKKFCKNPLYALDLLVVSVSIAMEIVVILSVAGVYDMFKIAWLLILLRFWRFLRIG